MQKTEISLINLTVPTTSELSCMPHMTKLNKNQLSQNHIIHARIKSTTKF